MKALVVFLLSAWTLLIVANGNVYAFQVLSGKIKQECLKNLLGTPLKKKGSSNTQPIEENNEEDPLPLDEDGKSLPMQQAHAHAFSSNDLGKLQKAPSIGSCETYLNPYIQIPLNPPRHS